jgi:predicted dehydrogenase
MTGAGIHVLDALVSVAGPVAEVYAKAAVRRAYPDALDTVTVALQFANGVSGTLATVRSSTFYWRLHVFGEHGSLEAVGENELVVRLKGRRPETLRFDPVDTLLAEFEAFADAIAGVAPYIASTDEMVHTVAAFEAIIGSMASGAPVRVG